MSLAMQSRSDTRPNPAPESRRAGSSPILRATAIVGLAAIAYIHLLDLSGKLDETPYLGVAYIGLIVGSIVAIGLLLTGRMSGFRLGGGLAAATFLGYVLSRTTGLPAATDDIGNWTETLGVWSLIAEGLVVVVSFAALTRPSRATA